MLDIDNILYFAYMEEQDKKQREQMKITVNDFMIPEPSEPPQKEKDNKKTFLPEI